MAAILNSNMATILISDTSNTKYMWKIVGNYFPRHESYN